jgi:peptide/nickel transport system permease protein
MASPTEAEQSSPALPPNTTKPANSSWAHARYVIGQNPVTALAFTLFAMFIVMAIIGPWVAPYDPLASNSGAAMQAPSLKHWFGTDAIGRDIFSRVLVATRLDFGIALAAVSLSFVAGMSLGILSGYYEGWVDLVIGRIADTIMAFPLFVLAMGIVAALGNTISNIILATAIINLPFYLRVARAETKIRRNAGFIEAARATEMPIGGF